MSKGRTNSTSTVRTFCDYSNLTVAATFPVHDIALRPDSLVVPICGIMEYIFRHEKRHILRTLCFKEFVIIKVYFEQNKFLNTETVRPEQANSPKLEAFHLMGCQRRIGL